MDEETSRHAGRQTDRQGGQPAGNQFNRDTRRDISTRTHVRGSAGTAGCSSPPWGPGPRSQTVPSAWTGAGGVEGVVGKGAARGNGVDGNPGGAYVRPAVG